MAFDDRLATVLRSPARGDAGVRTQYRQLLDLLGSMAEDPTGEFHAAGYERLAELAAELPAAEQSQILRAPGLRLRNRTLLTWLAHGEPRAAAAAMATARLSERDWLLLIPRLPVTARGFLRHRRDLPLSARQVLERLGVRDLVLPEPELDAALPVSAKSAGNADSPGESPAESSEEAGIGALVRRIEAFRRARLSGTPVEPSAPRTTAPIAEIDFATDPLGVIVWADAAVASKVVGMTLGTDRSQGLAKLDAQSETARRQRLPIRAGRLTLSGDPELEGEWHIDAAPLFALAGGAYEGHAGRLRRTAAAAEQTASDTTADRMRQVLHELRTPVNAIQGFAEIIQQQLFGAAPHEYRALAAGIAVDAARLMAGFDDLERLARLEGGARELAEGTCDLRSAIAPLLRRLDGVLRPRSARLALTGETGPLIIALPEAEVQAMAWRLLATLAGAMAPGEVIEIALLRDEGHAVLRAELPSALVSEADVFAAAPPPAPRAITAGMFGSGFALRLARAEAIAAGGMLERVEESLIVTLPALTGPAALHTQRQQG